MILHSLVAPPYSRSLARHRKNAQKKLWLHLAYRAEEQNRWLSRWYFEMTESGWTFERYLAFYVHWHLQMALMLSGSLSLISSASNDSDKSILTLRTILLCIVLGFCILFAEVRHAFATVVLFSIRVLR